MSSQLQQVKRWLYWDMNSFFAAAEQQDRPELRGVPIGIVPMLVSTTCCIAASIEAKFSGVKTGTGAAEAKIICPNIQLIEARPRLYRKYHEEIKQAVELVIPVHEVWSVDEMIAKPWANESELPNAIHKAQQIQDVIRYEVGEWLTCSVGIGPSPFLAKIAADLQKPRGISVIDLADIPHKLFGLKLRDWCGIARGMEYRFNQAGIRTTKEMYELALSDMRQIFGGIQGERWFYMIRGKHVDLPPVKRFQIGHSNVLSPELRTRTGSYRVAVRLLEKACERLRNEGYHAKSLIVSAHSYNQESWSRSMRCLACNRTWVFVGMLNRIWSDEINAPSHVHVSLQNIIKSEDVTLDLFPTSEVDLIDDTIDTINHRFGRGTLTVLSSLNSKDYLDHARIPFGKPTELR